MKNSPWYILLFLLGFTLVLSSCEKEDKDDDNDDPKVEEPVLRFKYKLDPNQERLGNLGTPATMPQGHAGQNPQFNGISAHYVELAPTAYTQIGDVQQRSD